MTDRILAIAALIALIAFLSTVPIFVPHIDLIIFTLGCVALAAFDFWRELFRRKRPEPLSGDERSLHQDDGE